MSDFQMKARAIVSDSYEKCRSAGDSARGTQESVDSAEPKNINITVERGGQVVINLGGSPTNESHEATPRDS